MKKILTAALLLACSALSVCAQDEPAEPGVYKTKDEFINQKITRVGKIMQSDNFNVGQLNVQLADRSIITISCMREHYFGFHYTDGNDYILVDGVYARVVLIGNASLMISPKADFKVDENGKYTFTPPPGGTITYYFERDLAKSVSVKFERAIGDDKALLEKYKSEKGKDKDSIGLQLKYLLLFNDKAQKDLKKANVSKSGKKHR